MSRFEAVCLIDSWPSQTLVGRRVVRCKPILTRARTRYFLTVSTERPVDVAMSEMECPFSLNRKSSRCLHGSVPNAISSRLLGGRLVFDIVIEASPRNFLGAILDAPPGHQGQLLPATLVIDQTVSGDPVEVSDGIGDGVGATRLHNLQIGVLDDIVELGCIRSTHQKPAQSAACA